MENAATRPTAAPETVHPFKPLPRVDVHLGDEVVGGLESINLASWRISFVAPINRIGCISIVPGPASGVPTKVVRRREVENWTEEGVLTTDSTNFESVPTFLT